ncbi:hypothetical protein ES703_16281 [subsurface metagenome]
MTEKFTVLRSESKLKNIDPEIQKLFDQKHVRIIKAQEEEAEEAEQTENDLLATIAKLAIENAKDIMKITEQKGFSLPEEKENKEENLETLTKSLEAKLGVPLKAVIKGRRRVRIE